MKLSWQYDSLATLMDRRCWIDIFVLLNIYLILMMISLLWMIRAVKYLLLWVKNNSDFSDVEQKYKLDDMWYTWNVQRTAYGVNNHWLALHTLKNSCTGKLKSIKLTLHYQVKRFRSCVNLEGPFFVIGTSIHYVVYNFLFPSSQYYFTCNVALIK